MSSSLEATEGSTLSRIPAAADAKGGCFHCGLPVPLGSGLTVVAGGERRPVCCAGCQAVASAILGQGLGDYYRLREVVAGQLPDGATVEDTSVYDDPAFQKTFVRPVNGASEATLLLEGIRCAACIWLNEQVISRMPGVLVAHVNYATQRAQIRWDPQRVRLGAILEAIQAIGYRAHPYDPRRVDLVQRREQRDALGRLFVAGFGMMQVMMYAVPVYLADIADMSWDLERLFRWAGFILTLPVVFYSAAPFFRGAVRDLRIRRLGMDVPVALGVALAFGASLVATVTEGGEVYYDSIAMFICFLLCGRYLELLARRRATRALQHLGRVVPEFAERVPGFPASNASERVPATALKPGEHVIVRTGQQVPADGVVESGEGSVDESLLSGEARPVRKARGDILTGGSVNLSAPLVMRVTQTGSDTVLSGIIRLAERAAGEKHQLAVMADRTAGVFILSVIVLSCIAAGYWALTEPSKAVWVAVSVLVATCPCAFSLATPVALTAATGELARRGFVVTRAHAVEMLGRATDIVLDKTGTLTRGETTLTDLDPRRSLSRDWCLGIAAAMEAGAAHPVASAIGTAARLAGCRTPAAENVVSVAGSGIEATVGGRRYRIGTPRFAAGLDEATSPDAEPLDSERVILADQSGVLAVFHFGDELRPDAAAAVAALKALGVTLHLVSGDAGVSVRSVGGKVGIEQVVARALPLDKQRYVRELQRRGAIVAMVGDGVNDAPVLAAADTSVAMGNGAYLAQTQADAVVVSGRLADVAWAVRHSRKVLSVIRQNIAWSFAYNLAVLPLAFMGVVSPWMAAIGMSASSLLVVLNALRLVGRGEPGALHRRENVSLAPA